MQILYIIDSLQPGGAERSLETLAPALIDRGVRLDVLYLHERAGLADSLSNAGARLHSAAGSASRRRWLKVTQSLVRQLSPDLAHTTLFEADQVGRLAAAMNRTPVVSSLVGLRYGPEQRSNPNYRVTRLLAAQSADVVTARLVRRFHAVSDQVADSMSRRLLVSRNRIDVIHRGRDPRKLGRRTAERRERVRQELGLQDRPVVLAVARQEYVKGLDRLIAVTRQLRSQHQEAIVLVAGGAGGATDQLVRQVDEAGLTSTIRFLGAREDVADLMCAADVLVLPSRSEGFPGVLIEAMLLELPIVANDLPSVREVLGPHAGPNIIDAADAGALTSAISRTLASPPDVLQLRERALALFGVDAVADATLDFYERALHQR